MVIYERRSLANLLSIVALPSGTAPLFESNIQFPSIKEDRTLAESGSL